MELTPRTRRAFLPHVPDSGSSNVDKSAHIQGRVQISGELKLHKLGEEPQKGSEQIRTVHKVR